MTRAGSGTGALAIVLHTHMPYVEGFGTWPFGEEWLWESIATSYLPLLDVLDARPGRASSTSSSGRYEVAIDSHSHSSPNGQVPKPST